MSTVEEPDVNEADTDTGADAPWWRGFHDDLLAQLFLERHDPDALAATLDFIEAQLGVEPGAHLFDQCCGIGSLALPLAARGYRLSGVDQAANYIDRARTDARARPDLAIAYVAADARVYRPEEPVDGAFNWWTSFGYAERDEDNARMLAAAFASLRPGGAFLLDTMNAAGVLRRFQPHVVTRRPLAGGELILARESTVDLEAGAIDQRWTYFLPDGRRVEHRTRVRLYQPHELVRLLRGVGFVDVELLGGVAGEPLDLDTLRCICRARRPS
jgi:SAM-dependent methyltransferase